MENLLTGFELLFVGIIIVFIVLILLMYIMKLMSVLVSKSVLKTNTAKQVAEVGSNDEELAAIMALFANKFPDGKDLNITVKQLH